MLKFQGFSDMRLMEQRNGSLGEEVGEVMLCLVVKYWCRIRQIGQDEHVRSRCDWQVRNLKFGKRRRNSGEELDKTGRISGGRGDIKTTSNDTERQMNLVKMRKNRSLVSHWEGKSRCKIEEYAICCVKKRNRQAGQHVSDWVFGE